MKDFFTAIRPGHWLKNALVLCVAVMDWLFDEPAKLWQVLISAGLFCLLSAAGYLVNDWRDREEDLRSPIRRNRPAARGRLGAGASIGGAVALAAAAFGGAWLTLDLWQDWWKIAGLYLTVALLYTFVLKNQLWPGAAGIACGAILRIMAGEAAVGAYPDRWLIPSLFALSFLVVFGKRALERPEMRGPALTASLIFSAAAVLAVNYYFIGFVHLLFEPEGAGGLQWVSQVLTAGGVARFLWVCLRPAQEPVDLYRRVARDPILAPVVAGWLVWFVYFGNWWAHAYLLL